MAWFDGHIVDWIVNLMGVVSRGVAFINGAIDKYLVDGAVNGTAGAAKAAPRSRERDEEPKK